MTFVQRYEQGIDQLVSLCPSPDKFAHQTAGLLFWLLSAMVLRKPLYSRGPLAVVVLVEGANEYIDFLAHGAWRWPDTIGDAAATWFWPFALSFCLSRFPRLRGARA